jgi:hypothetical protein
VCAGVTPLVIVPEEPKNGGNATGGQWNEVIDPKSGRAYYVNSVTGQSSWVKPGSGNQQGSSPCFMEPTSFVRYHRALLNNADTISVRASPAIAERRVRYRATSSPRGDLR